MNKPLKNTTTFVCANHKGGSGKTSLAVALLCVLAEMGYRVLGIDGDMQKNLTTSFGLRGQINSEKNFYRAIMDLDEKEDYNALDYVMPTEYENIDFITAHEEMAMVEMSLFVKMVERERYVQKVVQDIKESNEYDFIVIDTGPQLGMLNFNIFVASDILLLPVNCSSFDADGLISISNFYKSTQKVNKNLKIGGIVLTRVDKRESITNDAIDVVKEMFGELVFDTMIGVDTNVKKSQWDEIPLVYHSPTSRASIQYKELIEEVLEIVK